MNTQQVGLKSVLILIFQERAGFAALLVLLRFASLSMSVSSKLAELHCSLLLPLREEGGEK